MLLLLQFFVLFCFCCFHVYMHTHTHTDTQLSNSISHNDDFMHNINQYGWLHMMHIHSMYYINIDTLNESHVECVSRLCEFSLAINKEPSERNFKESLMCIYVYTYIYMCVFVSLSVWVEWMCMTVWLFSKLLAQLLDKHNLCYFFQPHFNIQSWRWFFFQQTYIMILMYTTFFSLPFNVK